MVLRHSLGCLLLVAVACHDEGERAQVHAVPPPRAAPAPPPVATPELPPGAFAPGAKVLSVTDAATGTPVLLGAVPDSFDVLVLVAFGPEPSLARAGGSVQLVVRGIGDSVQVLRLPGPAPSQVAHAFRVSRLTPGPYALSVRLSSAGGVVLAESVPMRIDVPDLQR